MTALFQSLVVTTPWALAALLLLPAIWWLLRFTPPRPETVRFPPLRLLLDLVSKEEQPDKTPWWLLALRLALAALVILAVSHPLYAPGFRADAASTPLLLVVDDTWAAAKDWPTRRTLIEETLNGAARAQALTAVATTAPQARPSELALTPADRSLPRALALEPKALAPDRATVLERLKAAFGAAPNLRVVWLSDGVDSGDARAFADGLLGLAGGAASLDIMTPNPLDLPPALAAPVIEGGRIKVAALRAPTRAAAEIAVQAKARNGRSLAEAKLTFAAGAGRAEAVLELPLELRNEAARIELATSRTAGGVYLLDDRWRRKTVALYAGTSIEAAQPLLSPLYYVSRALEPFAEVSQPADIATVAGELDRGLSMLALADIGIIPPEAQTAIAAWIDRGGVLLRFAGPRLAAGEDAFVPVRIREGGRALGSALSWETPQPLQPFPDASPFAGLVLDAQVKIDRQVLAEPDMDLSAKVWAALADGTPLVTAEKRGKGLLVLFHVTANADWSNLPLSGLFVEMLRRVLDLAPGAGGGAAPAAQGAQAQAYSPLRMLSGLGDLIDPMPEAVPIPARDFDRTRASAIHPVGLYARGASERAINLSLAGDALTPIADLPSSATVRGLEPAPSIPLAPVLFALAFLLFLADCIAALFISGGLRRLRYGPAAIVLALALIHQPTDGFAQSDEYALRNATQTRLAYVLTGDAETDNASEMGLSGLGLILMARTSVEPGSPAAVNLERDELVFFPLLYWPILADAQAPSDAALARLNAFVKNGGTILFDTREDGLDTGSLAGGTSRENEALRRVLAKLDIPPLEPVPPDHVLTKAFYLMDGFPGRYENGQLWVETGAAQGGGAANGDGVSSIIIGSNDYAAAWALDERGEPVFATVPGGERQRELAYRAGINIVMYALTGNYKADQVHVPALLERLGQ